MITTQDLVSAHPFLTGIAPRHLERLAPWAHRATFPAGARIFQEGGKADRFWLLRDGQVELRTRVPGRGEVVVETIGPGTVLGWSWLFPPHRWHFSAVSVDPVLALVVDGAGVRGLCAAEPAFGYELANRFMAVMVERLQATRIRLLDLYDNPS